MHAERTICLLTGSATWRLPGLYCQLILQLSLTTSLDVSLMRNEYVFRNVVSDYSEVMLSTMQMTTPLCPGVDHS